MKPLSAALQTTYSNLVQAHLDRPAFEFNGAPFTRKINNKVYWYANHRVAPGAPLKQKYLGPDTNEMRTRVDRMRVQQQSQADFRDYTSGLVAQLRAGGVQGPGRKDGPILRALTNSGVFRLGGTLVGTHAFRHYDLVLGVLWEGPQRITETDDIDVASFERLSMAIDDVAEPDLAQALMQLKLEPVPTLNSKKPTSWVLADRSYRVDFLTPSFTEKEAPTKLVALNMWAQGLHYLNFLIADPIDAVSPYMEGLLIRIPRPERYAVHKLIISQRRNRSSAKARKDIEQARTLIWAMADVHSHALRSAIADAKGPSWSEALDRALKITFKAPTMTFDFDRDIIRFDGAALGEMIEVAISGEALEDHFGAKSSKGEDRLEAARSNRSKIEALAQRLFRTEPSRDLLIGTHDVKRMSRN